MEILPSIRERHSVRAYRDAPVDPACYPALIEAVRLAPSACNSQPWTVVMVDRSDLVGAVAAAVRGPAGRLNGWAAQVPVFAVLVVEAPRLSARLGSLIKRRDLPWIDIGIAAGHFCLQAVACGLGTCMLGWFDERRIRRLLGIPRRKRIALVIALGHPAADHAGPARRKAPAAMAAHNAYAAPWGAAADG
ncbi:MAG: nitroreductase family protein [Planctomycetota bacterium]